MSEQSIYRHLREFREAFDRPEPLAWPEISHGQLLMMMSPKKQHQLVAHRLRLQLEPQLDADLVLMVETDMEDAALGVLRVPDLVVIDEEEATTDSDAIDPRRSHLVIEIVSRSNPANDYEGKLRDYPAMGVPHYVIVDPRDGSAVHYWAPTRRSGETAYDNRQHYRFGDTVTVGKWKIDTAGLPRYAADRGQ
ncbi:Uma2 family endonuclease [Streptomyces sp. RP5T]|uniref:Uma2 family endonuclease n=1 Tax=Streptomyces sp. RP5T TaxID=2490848 RepID=UPI000F64886F|nr:Uma2 family endonuclease [Streptomyces sp. RP5T]RRR84064.1 Uma2 family endonuclease [Streptomyces sp. RP5T]